MKNTLLSSILIFLALNYSQAQSFDKSLASMYFSADKDYGGSNDWINLKPDGTGKFCVSNNYQSYMGCKNFSWTSDEERLIISFKDQYGMEKKEYLYLIKKNETVEIKWATGIGPNFIYRRK